MGVLKFPKLGLLWFWTAIILCVDLWLRWGLKQSCSLRRDLSNDMSHATCTKGNRVDSWLSFVHNLCFKCPNESCEPNLNIYVSIAFQWYKFFSNPMGFHPCNCSLKNWEFIGTSTPQLGVALGVWGFILTQEYKMCLLGLPLVSHFCKPLPWS
jgi:hypothetical protein